MTLKIIIPRVEVAEAASKDLRQRLDKCRDTSNRWMQRSLQQETTIDSLRDENGSLRNRLSRAYAERGDREITLNKVIEERDALRAERDALQRYVQLLVGINMDIRTLLLRANQRLRALWLNQTPTKQ